MPKISKSDLPAEVQKYIDELEDQVAEYEAYDIDALVKSNGDLQTENETLRQKVVDAGIEKNDPLSEVLAKADPATRKVLEKMQSDNNTLAERIAKQEEAAHVAQMVSKAEAIPMISTDKADLADVLKQVYAASDELGNKVYELFKAADTQIAQGNLFTEFGAAGGEVTLSQSVESAASELQKADSTLTREMAIAKAYEQNPNLYLQELKEGK